MTALAEALVAAQAEMPAVEPNATHPQYKSKFVSLDHLIALTRPVLNRHGLAIVQLPAISELGAPVLRTILIHGATGEQISAETPLMLAKQDMQAFGSAITYARRYAWAAALGISSEIDTDGEPASSAGEPSRAAAPPPPPSTGQVGQVASPADDPAAGTPFQDDITAPVEPAGAYSKRKPTEQMLKKLNVLVGQLRPEHVSTLQLWQGMGREPEASEDGLLHWSPLRDSLTFAEAAKLIGRLEEYANEVHVRELASP